MVPRLVTRGQNNQKLNNRKFKLDINYQQFNINYN